MPNRSINSFSAGLNQDIDKLSQPNESYRYAMNGRVIFNKDGTLSWVNENGMKLSFTLEANTGADANTYIPIGSTGQSNLLVLLTVAPITGNSEIGIAISDQNGICAYKTLFNDQNDPNGDLLNFQPYNQIEARFLYENDNMIRVYWVDGVKDDSNQPRVFTFKYDSTIGPRDDVNAYSAVTTSVHSINTQAEFSMGLIKYVQSISGDLTSGVYQYTYRLVTVDGYQTPWFPLTRTIFVTSDDIDNTNWNKYEMESSGTASNKGNRIQVKGIDTRFSEIEVAFVYSTAPTVSFEANIFAITSITSDTMTFDHIANGGEPIDSSTIPAIFAGIRAAKTLNIKDKILYYGNIVEGFFDVDADTVLSGVTLTPIFRDMRSDERNYTDIENPPVTHQAPDTTTTTKAQHNAAGGDETYTINNDYVNYKGTQVEHLYQGYFRGETYRFGIVFFDKLGFPSFVYHLADVTFPEQYQDTYSYSRIESDGTIVLGVPVPFAESAWPTNNYGAYVSDSVVDGEDTSLGDFSYLRIQGIEFSGIDITTIVNDISGFQIVRVERDKSILMQGLIMPCVREDDITRPFPAANQAWFDANGMVFPSAATDIGNMLLNGLNMLGNTQGLATPPGGVTDNFLLRPNISNFYAPDYWFDPTRLPTLQTQDVLKLVGGCWTETHPGQGGATDDLYTQFFTVQNHCSQKLYYSRNPYHLSGTPVEPYPEYGDTTNPTDVFSLGLGGQELNYAAGLDFHNNWDFEDQDFAGFDDAYELKTWGMPATLSYVHPDFSGAAVFKPSPIYHNTEVPLNGFDAPYSGYFISNYVRDISNPYGGQSLSSLEQNIFIATGHFQPVNNATFTTPVSNIFDGVEVWGGDCYLDYFGFLRGYGRIWAAPGGQGDDVDAANGHVFPLESELNVSLRNAPSSQNPMYTDVGSRGNQEIVTPGSTNFPDGLFFVDDTTKLMEEFNLNSVLLYTETIQFYNPKPIRFQDNHKFPIRWRYSQVKFYGDPIDSWRIFQVNDFDDLNGQYGEITSSLYLLDQIYSWQESAFGRLRASDRALIESAMAGSLTTGVGGKLDGVDYISTVSGNQHQWSLFTSGKAAYWINVDLRKICRFAQDGYVELSDMRGLHQFAEIELPFFENMDNPAYSVGISGVFDSKNKDAKWSFIRERTYEADSFTMVSRYSAIADEIIIDDDELAHIIYTGDGITDLMIIPVSETAAYGVNTLLNFYFYLDATTVEDMPVHLGTSGTTLFFTALPGNYYKIYRNHLTDTFSVTNLGATVPRYKQYKTLTYAEVNDRFEMFNSYGASFYANIKDLVLSYNQVDSNVEREFYVHDIGLKGNFYGEDHDALLDVVNADNAVMAKIYDNLYMNATRTLLDNMAKVMMYCDEQYYELVVTGDDRFRYQEGKLRFTLRTLTQEDRMRGKHIRMLFEITNDLNREVRITNLETLSRPSPRI